MLVDCDVIEIARQFEQGMFTKFCPICFGFNISALLLQVMNGSMLLNFSDTEQDVLEK